MDTQFWDVYIYLVIDDMSLIIGFEASNGGK